MSSQVPDARHQVSERGIVETAPAHVMSRLLRSVRLWIAVVILVSAAAGAGVYQWRSQTEATYQAVARFAIVPSDALLGAAPADLVDSIAALDRPIVNATVSELLQSGVVAEAAATTIDLPLGTLSGYEIEAAEIPGSAVVRLSVTGPNRTTAATLTQAIRDDAPTTLRGYLTVFDVKSVDGADVGARRVGPNPERDAVAVGVAVALFGIAVVLLIGTRRDISRSRAFDLRRERQLYDSEA